MNDIIAHSRPHSPILICQPAGPWHEKARRLRDEGAMGTRCTFVLRGSAWQCVAVRGSAWQCVADMSNTFRLIIRVAVSSNENAL